MIEIRIGAMGGKLRAREGDRGEAARALRRLAAGFLALALAVTALTQAAPPPESREIAGI